MTEERPFYHTSKQDRLRRRSKKTLDEIRARKGEIMANIQAMREEDGIEDEMIAREHAQIVRDYMEYGQDYVLQRYHGGIALVNLLQGLKSKNAEERAYWSKIGLDLTDKAEARKQKRIDDEKPGDKGITVVIRRFGEQKS